MDCTPAPVGMFFSGIERSVATEISHSEIVADVCRYGGESVVHNPCHVAPGDLSKKSTISKRYKAAILCIQR